MSPHIRHRAPLVLAVLGLMLTLWGVWYFLLKPWPGVTASDEWTVVNPPPGNVYTSNQPLSWTKPEVCVPPGVTTVQILVRVVTVTGTFDSLAYTRIITNQGETYCRSPNPTTIAVPDWIPNGKFQIIIRSCTDTPNPRDTCLETDGPIFGVTGASF